MKTTKKTPKELIKYAECNKAMLKMAEENIEHALNGLLLIEESISVFEDDEWFNFQSSILDATRALLRVRQVIEMPTGWGILE